ncbi:MAG: gluconokinase, GntK/IdnK-type [Bifidobacterium mongoliense]|nr:gluconokinase, GntK/IdnK-type [Bifidobacterium mongoliense]
MRSQSTIDSRSSAVQQGSASREDTDLGALGRDDVIVANTIPAGYFDSAEPVLVVMGPAGSGKTAVSAMIAAGIPLNDDDRWGWLDTIATWIRRHVDERRPAVVTCSALKRIYRDRLRMPGVVFVYLDGDYDTVMGLLSHRQGHFMKPEMLASQFAILERPGNDEVHVSLDLGRHPTVEEESRAIVEILHLAPRTA